MKHLTTENRIFAATRAMISEHGVEGVSMRKVASRVGVTAGAIYRHFANKDALIERVVADAFHNLEASLWRALARFPVGSLERISELGRMYVEFAKQSPADYRLLFATTSKTRRPVETGPFYRLVRILEECVRDCIACGLLIDRDPRMISLLLWGRLHGLVMLFLAFDFSTDYPTLKPETALEDAVEATRLLLFEGLERKQT